MGCLSAQVVSFTEVSCDTCKLAAGDFDAALTTIRTSGEGTLGAFWKGSGMVTESEATALACSVEMHKRDERPEPRREKFSNLVSLSTRWLLDWTPGTWLETSKQASSGSVTYLESCLKNSICAGAALPAIRCNSGLPELSWAIYPSARVSCSTKIFFSISQVSSDLSGLVGTGYMLTSFSNVTPTATLTE